MKTEQILKRIYKELQSEIMEKPNHIFLKEYTIPSINFNYNNEENENLYFSSGIEMELYKMMEYFENKIYFNSYKDKYFFSNNAEKLQKRLMLEISEQENIETDLEI